MKFFFRRFKRIRSIDLDDEIYRQIFLFKELMILRNYVRTLILRGLEFFTFGESVYGFLLKLKITFIIIQKRSP